MFEMNYEMKMNCLQRIWKSSAVMFCKRYTDEYLVSKYVIYEETVLRNHNEYTTVHKIYT